jgi:hypothetical protein
MAFFGRALAAAWVAAAALAVGGCTDSVVSEITGPDPATKCQASITDLPASVAASAARLAANVSTNRDCLWTIKSEASWIQVRPASGQGPASVSVDVSENRAAIERSTTLVLSDSHVTVTQQAAPCRFELGSSSSRVAAPGGPFQIAVSTIAGCKWRASSGVPWVRVASSEVTGSGSAEFVADMNTGEERSGTLTIAGLSHVVQQTAPTSSPVPPPHPAGPPLHRHRPRLRRHHRRRRSRWSWNRRQCPSATWVSDSPASPFVREAGKGPIESPGRTCWVGRARSTTKSTQWLERHSGMAS